MPAYLLARCILLYIAYVLSPRTARHVRMHVQASHCWGARILARLALIAAAFHLDYTIHRLTDCQARLIGALFMIGIRIGVQSGLFQAKQGKRKRDSTTSTIESRIDEKSWDSRDLTLCHFHHQQPALQLLSVQLQDSCLLFWVYCNLFPIHKRPLN